MGKYLDDHCEKFSLRRPPCTLEAMQGASPKVSFQLQAVALTEIRCIWLKEAQGVRTNKPKNVGKQLFRSIHW